MMKKAPAKSAKGKIPAGFADGGKVKGFKPCAGCANPAKCAKAGACMAKAKK